MKPTQNVDGKPMFEAARLTPNQNFGLSPAPAPMNIMALPPGFHQSAPLNQQAYTANAPTLNQLQTVPGFYAAPYGTTTPVLYQSAAVMYSPPQIVMFTPSMTTPTRTLGPNSCLYTCQHCRQTSMTRSQRKLNDQGRVLALLLCIFCYPLIWLVMCYHTNYKVEHYCTQCHCLLGVHDQSQL